MPQNSPFLQDDDDVWDERDELLLLTWAEKAAGLRWLHVEAGKLQSYLNDALSVPVVILSALAGLGSITNNACSGWIGVAFTVINLANATLVSFQRYSEPGQKASTHKAIAADYSKLYRSVAQQLSLPIRRRENCVEFTTATRTEYDRLVSSSLDVPACIVRRFKRRFAATEQAKPEVVSGGIEQIPHRRPTEVPVLPTEQGPLDAAAMGGAVTQGPGLPPAGSRKMRRASTVIQDVLKQPGVPLQLYRSTRLPEAIPSGDLELNVEDLRARGIDVEDSPV